MSPQDARLALQRHATSKIASPEDLQRIGTFGFRGEALPAIASVSQLRLRTRPRGGKEAFELRVRGGRILEGQTTGGPEGTRVEVADLFAAVPARRKFLKRATTEWGHVADWLARAALALPEVHFEVRRDDRPAIVWPATPELLDRIAAVISEDDAAAFVPVAAEDGRATLTGFVSRPDRHRPTMAGIHWFVNRRAVRDRLLQHALVEVYRELLPRGRFPAAVLFLSVPLDAVDVNVHPTKREVRFEDPQWIHRLVRRAVRAAIAERRWIGAHPGAPDSPQADTTIASRERQGDATAAAEGGAVTIPRVEDLRSEGPADGDWIFAARDGEEPTLAEPRLRLGELRLLGQILATYLVLETKQGLLLVDQHAAHERVLYERLRAEWRERGVERQGLLVPAAVQLEPMALAALGDCAEGVERLGFDLEPFGEGTVAVRAVPALLTDRDPASLVRNLGEELAAAGPAADALRRGSHALEAADAIFAALACHGARRKGEVLDPREQRALIDALDAIPWAPSCPHGRPVAVPFELAEIERRFRRR
jgi:DNA mismatch repair protein MutL